MCIHFQPRYQSESSCYLFFSNRPIRTSEAFVMLTQERKSFRLTVLPAPSLLFFWIQDRTCLNVAMNNKGSSFYCQVSSVRIIETGGINTRFELKGSQISTTKTQSLMHVQHKERTHTFSFYEKSHIKSHF